MNEPPPESGGEEKRGALETLCFHGLRLSESTQTDYGGENMAKLTPSKAIRAKCLECSNGQFKEVRLRPVKNCPLYEYRNGHRPKGEELSIESGLE